MDDLISRSAALAAVETVPHTADQVSIYDIKDELKNLPAVDAVAVVRCRDCVHYEFGFCVRSILYSKGPNGYCENGERRSDT